MINIKHLLKVSAAWTSIVYVVCFAGVAMFPGIRPGFMMYGLHMGYNMMGYYNVINLGTFLSRLVIWNIIVLAAVLLFAVLFNNIKQ